MKKAERSHHTIINILSKEYPEFIKGTGNLDKLFRGLFQRRVSGHSGWEVAVSPPGNPLCSASWAFAK